MTSKNAGRIKAAVKSMKKQPKDSDKQYVVVRAKNSWCYDTIYKSIDKAKGAVRGITNDPYEAAEDHTYMIMELVPVLKLKSTSNLVEEPV